MSVGLSAKECQKYVMEGKPWGSYSGSEYSTSGYSNISSSPMQCSSKLDETSSVCSSNSSTTTDMARLPKPPPSLGRRKHRKLNDHTAEMFEFSDLVLEPVTLKPESCNMVNTQPFIENDNQTNDESHARKDRYEALRNIGVNDNDDTFCVQKSQNVTLSSTNPFASNYFEPCNSEPTTQTGTYQNRDKYAAISDAIAISEQTGGGEFCGSLKWSRSVMGQGEYGWSEQIIHGDQSC